jgi:hypothetical protein
VINRRYFLVPYFHAESLSENRERDSELRLESMLVAKRLYMVFLARCQEFRLLHAAAKASFMRMQNDEQGDPSAARMEKIEQKRQEVAIRDRMKQLQAAVDKASNSASGMAHLDYELPSTIRGDRIPVLMPATVQMWTRRWSGTYGSPR